MIIVEIQMKLEEGQNIFRRSSILELVSDYHALEFGIMSMRNDYETLRAERDALLQEREEAVEIHSRIMSEECPSDEYHCTCVPALRQELAEMKTERDALKAEIENLEAWQKKDKERLFAYSTERDALKADATKAVNLMKCWMEMYQSAKLAYEKYKAERDAYKSALEIYADESNWIDDDPLVGLKSTFDYFGNGWEKARTALEAQKAERDDTKI